jgi:CDP-paratose 2-epimerase
LLEHGIQFVHGDIRNKEDFDGIGNIDLLIEAAAEPSVLSGIDSTPDYLLNTNLQGTINCLNFAVKNKAKFIFLSTSRVYPIKHLNRIQYTEAESRFEISDCQELFGISKKGIAENFPLDGARSFYGSSKLASELLIQEYIEFYNLKAIINRCGVITGPWQMGKIDQGVIVLWMAKHFWKKELSYIGYGGTGKQVRDVLHIDDLFRLIDIQMNNFELYSSETFNAGGGLDVSVSLRELTALCEEITGNKIPIHSIKENRTADVPVYITDNTKITNLSGWKPENSPHQLLNDIFEWIKNNENKLKPLLQ